MKQYYQSCAFFWLHLLVWFHALWMINSAKSDELALLDFKNQITQDPLQIMSSWNASIQFCNWTGVTCSSTNGRVTILNLASLKLAGTIPPSIGNLTALTAMNLYNNSFHGELPQEIGRLQHLQTLNFSNNYFGGSIPTNLSRCAKLRILGFAYNEFIGQIPEQLGSLSKLVFLSFGANHLSGKIPASIGNLSSLASLFLSANNLQGSIPEELGLILGLRMFQLAGNNLSGTIPYSIFNLSLIFYFSVTENQLQGQLPSDVGLTLHNLEMFGGGANYFTGSIPASLSNASNLSLIDFGQNSLTGNIPESLGRLKSLYRLNFGYNRLGKGEVDELNFFSSLANCTSLQILGLYGNGFGGELPKSIGNLSTQLQVLDIGGNLIHGNIPAEIGNLVNLVALSLKKNYLIGRVPEAIGRLQNLQALYLDSNKVSGSIPYSLGNMAELITLVLNSNDLEGSIPPSLGRCQKLLALDLSNNKLNGTIPREVVSLSSISKYLRLSNNFLTGSLPVDVGNLKNLVELDVSKNKLSGEIPSSLGSCTSLARLYLGSNMFGGTIPESLEGLRGLEELDLSWNNLSGQIPEFLSQLSFLKYLNLAYNKLEGEVPKGGIFAYTSANISLIGNDKLCVSIPELLLPLCPTKVFEKHTNIKVVISITIGVTVAILLVISFILYSKMKFPKTTSSTSSINSQLFLSYSDILKSTDNFSDENLLGVGSFGSVYKGAFPGEEKIVAIKVLKVEHRRALKSFTDECNALKSIRHRNILKILNVCSSIDYEGNDFKALVFEFMCNGSLDKWLHPVPNELCGGINILSFMQRLNVAIDVASAFEYLHHYCETPVVHCDLKPSNVLLDEDMTAHVGDFGLSKLLLESSNNASTSAGLRGSIGYIPPEYTDGHVSRLGDIYSYGILLLEMFTSKRPTDNMFKDGLNIHKFVSAAFPDHVMDVVDPSLLFEEENEDDGIEEAMNKNFEPQTKNQRKTEELLVAVMRIGLMCSKTSPRERMPMNQVVNNLKAVKNLYL